MFGQLATLMGLAPGMILLFVLVALWDGIWKAIGLWKSGNHKQLGWFIFILLFNTLGILPIIYLLFFQKKRIAVIGKKSRRKKRR
jgi:hypothetical protein